MKRILRFTAALLGILLLTWYCLPPVYRVLHLPDVVRPNAELSAPTLSVKDQTARLVRESEDERISDALRAKTDILLFGFLPLKTVQISAHGRTVYAGGETVGVILHTEGVQIVGFEKIDTPNGAECPAILAGLKEGDMICAVNGTTVSNADAFATLCAAAGDICTLSCLRDGAPFLAEIRPVKDRSGERRIGAWVRDSTSGVGTLSFYDGSSGAYAALGHGVTDVDTHALIAPAKGYLTDSVILEIRKGNGNAAGELMGQFSVSSEDAIATIDSNTAFGIYGRLTQFRDADRQSFEIAPGSAAHRGEAYILSMVDDRVSAYSVNVIRVDVQSSPDTQGLMIEITDPALLEKTGGIVQGMSGSPLIQDGRLIGVVTHVFLSQPTRGYCIYAEWMERYLNP